MLTIFSKKITKIPYLSEFLREPYQLYQWGVDKSKISGVAGWGYRPTTIKARKFATENNVPFTSLEDGFLRSFGAGQNFPPLSMVLDTKGIYYDSTKPSDLELILNSDEDVLEYREAEVAAARAEICQNELSKYNHAPIVDLKYSDSPQKKILLIDQTYGDMSVDKGGASASTFFQMLHAARQEHKDALIFIKTHPEVSSGTKSGYLTNVSENENTILLREPCNPIHLLKQVDHVYAVSSTMGFEALLLGKPVSVFGLPWYAGWGVTDDRQYCERRNKKRSVNELFAAAYFDYTRYLNPQTHQLGTIFDVIGWLKLQKEQENRFSGRMICIGFRLWKAANLKPMLSLFSEKVFFAKTIEKAKKLKITSSDNLVRWGASVSPDLIALSKESGARLLHLEDGFVRSVGLGSDLIPPMSLVLDERGLYFDATQTSDLEYILNNTIFTPEDLVRAQWIQNFIVANGITKYNVEPRKQPQWHFNGKPVLLVIGQVEDDASILCSASAIRTNLGLLKKVRETNPNAYIVFKPHPDVLSGNRQGKMSKTDALEWADYVETDLSIVSCIESCEQLHTMTSLSGFDALLRGKKVFAYGRPFYAGWGLLENEAKVLNRNKQLTILELIVGVLIKYPFYWDQQLCGYTTCEAVLEEIVKRRQSVEERPKNSLSIKSKYLQRQFYKLRTLIRLLLTN